MVAMAKLLLVLAVDILTISMVESKLKETNNAEEQHQLERVNGQGGQKNGKGSLKSSQCPEQCLRRCSQTRYKKPCLFFCLKCCRACLCVPSGYYGNKEECPCYNNWKTKRGGPRCP
ncbi:Gibberellin-regulated family protein [Rhynchospora pubera]|uniref:Gibberellin-regulated family protein n=1 Tax=Rhynchospora pubera TaxID=906938 RepID=A0AAV8DTD1_9POAL|nr:Gibberellin-regulated family protein [Rhynchospora pubera]